MHAFKLRQVVKTIEQQAFLAAKGMTSNETGTCAGIPASGFTIEICFFRDCFVCFLLWVPLLIVVSPDSIGIQGGRNPDLSGPTK